MDVRLVVLESRFVAFDVVDEGINVSVSIEHLGDGPSTFLRWCVEDDGCLDGWYDCEVHVCMGLQVFVDDFECLHEGAVFVATHLKRVVVDVSFKKV